MNSLDNFIYNLLEMAEEKKERVKKAAIAGGIAGTAATAGSLAGIHAFHQQPKHDVDDWALKPYGIKKDSGLDILNHRDKDTPLGSLD